MIINEHKKRIESLIAHAGWRRELLNFIRDPVGGTNTSYYVEYEKTPYILRISAHDSNILSINRRAEHKSLQIASSRGIGAELVCFIETNGDMITLFETGKMPTVEEIQLNENQILLVNILKKLHSCKVEYSFNPYTDIDSRLSYLEEGKINIHKNESFQQVRELYQTIIANPPRGIDETRYFGLCHNDPCINNMILGKQRILLIDYEYAGMGNVFFDIASICGLWCKQEKINFLNTYFGNMEDKYLEYIKYFTIIQLVWNTTWGYVKSCGNSTNTIDYVGWANEQSSIALDMFRSGV